MKAFRLLTSVVLLAMLLAYAGCKPSSGTGETTQDKQLKLLSTTWKISTVTGPDGATDATALWPGFTLTVSGSKGATTFQYSCAGRPAASNWPSNGTWAFGADPVTQIIRDKGATGDELNMTYTVTATTLQINYNYSSGKIYTKVSGDWVFNFTK